MRRNVNCGDMTSGRVRDAQSRHVRKKKTREQVFMGIAKGGGLGRDRV